MMSFDKALHKLKKAGEKVTSNRGYVPKNILEKSVLPAYGAICAAYETATTEQRVETYLFFETRDNLLNALVRFAGDCAQEAVALTEMEKQDAALSALKQAVAADLIADGRCDPEPVEEMQAHLLKAIEVLGFKLDGYASKLSLQPAAFTKWATQLQKEANETEAIKALGVALGMDPRLATHPKAIDMAERLTHKDAEKIIPILSDRFERTLYIADQVRDQNKKSSMRSKKTQSPLSFWLTTIGGGIVLAVLPPVVFPLVFDLKADPGGAPPGLIVGTVTGVLFVMGQLKRRNGGGTSNARTPRRRLNH